VANPNINPFQLQNLSLPLNFTCVQWPCGSGSKQSALVEHSPVKSRNLQAGRGLRLPREPNQSGRSLDWKIYRNTTPQVRWTSSCLVSLSLEFHSASKWARVLYFTFSRTPSNKRAKCHHARSSEESSKRLINRNHSTCSVPKMKWWST
jgi:hypothetical protein